MDDSTSPERRLMNQIIMSGTLCLDGCQGVYIKVPISYQHTQQTSSLLEGCCKTFGYISRKTPRQKNIQTNRHKRHIHNVRSFETGHSTVINGPFKISEVI